MEWPKLKNIILLLLVFANVSLVFLLGGPAWESMHYERQSRREAIALLSEKGIGISEEIVPERMELTAQTAQRDLGAERLMAEKLLGESLEQQVRGGEVYRYENGNGAIQFHSDGTFSAQLNSAAFPVGDSGQKTALALLDKLDYEGEILSEEDGQITVGQSWKGTALFGQQVSVCWDDAGLTRLGQGSRLIGTPIPNMERETITVATALITLLNGLDELGDVYSRVHEIRQGYVSTTALSGPMELTPVWRITTDTGVYQLDLIDGQLSRVS